MMKRVFSQPFPVVGALIEDGGTFLLVQEAHTTTGEEGQWNHPAGWLEMEENPLEAVQREVKEETGYDFTPEHILGVYSLVKKENQAKTGDIYHPIKIMFTGSLSGTKDTLADDVHGCRWFTSSEIEQMDVHTLRDSDIKKMVIDYTELERYPLGILEHTISK